MMASGWRKGNSAVHVDQMSMTLVQAGEILAQIEF